MSKEIYFLFQNFLNYRFCHLYLFFFKDFIIDTIITFTKVFIKYNVHNK